MRIVKLMVAAATVTASGLAAASHSTAAISDIDGTVTTNPQTFSGSYTHSSIDHPWFTFEATAGADIGIALETTFGQGTGSQGSYLWLYRVLDGVADIGDSIGNSGLELIAQSSNNDTDDFLNQSISTTLASSGLFAVQVDSWLGGSGNYSVTIRGANITSVPEPGSLLLASLGLGIAGMIARRKRI